METLEKIEVNTAVERLKEIKSSIDSLSKERQEIENTLDDQIIYQNTDGTWTRFTKIDNIQELIEKGTMFRASSINRYTVKLETLKNKPKELT